MTVQVQKDIDARTATKPSKSGQNAGSPWNARPPPSNDSSAERA